MCRLQDPLVETAEFIAEMNESDTVHFDADVGTVCAGQISSEPILSPRLKCLQVMHSKRDRR